MRFRNVADAKSAARKSIHSIEGHLVDVRIPIPIHVKKQQQRKIREEDRRVYLKGLSRSMTHSDIHKILQNYGTVESFTCIKNDSDGQVACFIVYKEHNIGSTLIGKTVKLPGREAPLEFLKPKSAKQIKQEAEKAADRLLL